MPASRLSYTLLLVGLACSYGRPTKGWRALFIVAAFVAGA